MVSHTARLPYEAQRVKVGTDTGKETKKQKSPEAVYACGETWFMTHGHYKYSQKKQNIQQILLEKLDDLVGKIFFFSSPL